MSSQNICQIRTKSMLSADLWHLSVIPIFLWSSSDLGQVLTWSLWGQSRLEIPIGLIRNRFRPFSIQNHSQSISLFGLVLFIATEIFGTGYKWWQYELSKKCDQWPVWGCWWQYYGYQMCTLHRPATFLSIIDWWSVFVNLKYTLIWMTKVRTTCNYSLCLSRPKRLLY